MAEIQTLWLVGMMGSGKSTVGPLLARRLGRRFIDTDAEVERAVGNRVAEIFEREGEPAFRSYEREAIEACAGEAAVVALGGGAIEPPGVRERLAETGTVVYLRARPETLLARVGDPDSRPLLRRLSPAGRALRLEELLARRREAYESASIVIDTDDLAPAAVVEQLAERIGREAR
ncbi:MAG TPA: shikimate kinase [Myxococcota bacterium]